MPRAARRFNRKSRSRRPAARGTNGRRNIQWEELMGRLDGRVAIVTGAAQGIGATYAEALAAEGAAVALADVHDPAAAAAAVEAAVPGARTTAFTADVSDAAQVDALVDGVVARFGALDILVANAAICGDIEFGGFEDISPELWDRVMAVNAKGPFLCAKAAARVMRPQGYGKIVNVSSTMVFKGAAGLLHYVASKGAVLAMTRSLARELGDAGICVNSIAPGLTLSETVDARTGQLAKDRNIAGRALKRAQLPADLVGALLYLVSADSDFVTGQCVVVDGGMANH
jgi:NAD(P)-dependent dehydrogenase (short-subunit alcohol dehydrogenase family)